MALLDQSRTGGRYDVVAHPWLPGVLRKQSAKGADQVWEARPKWTRPELPANEHEVTALDLNGAFLSALKTRLPLGQLEHSTGGRHDRRRAGRTAHCPARCPAWLTPTRVGRAQQTARAPAPYRTDPHARGEDLIDSSMRRDSADRPPRARGSGQSLADPLPRDRGKAHVSTATTSTGRKHPHARGRHQAARSGRERHGKTPTRVGKDPYLGIGGVGAPERPPRVWGRRRETRHPDRSGGQTLTCVGKALAYLRIRRQVGGPSLTLHELAVLIRAAAGDPLPAVRPELPDR